MKVEILSGITRLRQIIITSSLWTMLEIAEKLDSLRDCSQIKGIRPPCSYLSNFRGMLDITEGSYKNLGISLIS